MRRPKDLVQRLITNEFLSLGGEADNDLEETKDPLTNTVMKVVTDVGGKATRDQR